METTSGKPVRRTQAERSATTRARIVDAAVTCLFEQGYGATTTVSVARTARVSRGAMLHHFPSKADLMLATLTHVIGVNAGHFRGEADRNGDARARYVALPDIRLAVASQPTGVAFMEIIVGARSDETVRARFAEFQCKFGRRTTGHMATLARDAGVGITPRDEAVWRTVALAVFGLAIQKQLMPQADTEDVLDVLRDLTRATMMPEVAPADALVH